MIKNSMVPLYQQLSEKIKQQITDGKLKAGDKLMTEAEFSQHFEVSRITVRKAIELLADDGFVVRKQGIGTFVAEKKLHRVVDNQIISFTEMSKMDGHVPSAELITVEWITPDGSIARKLRVDENEKVLRIVRLRKNDDVPVMIEDSYYPKRMEFLLKENLLGSTYEFFHNHGLIPTHSVKTVEICYATPEEAQRLGVPEKHALLLQKDEVFDQDDEVLHYSKLLTNPKDTVLRLLRRFMVAIILLPVCWLVLNSLKTNQEMFLNSLALPKKWMFVNYATAWGKGLLFYFKNSIIVSAISILCILLLSSMLAYGLTRFSLPGSGFVFFLILGGMALSEQVALVPLYKILQALKLYNTRAALILPYIAFRIPFTMFLMRAYFISIPKELEEAAIVDGCNSFQRFTQIILPISKPVMASCAIVNLNNVWNVFLFANVFLENKKLMTIPLGLMTFQGDLKSDYVVMLAGILIASLPMVLLFLCMSKQFVRGLTSGAVKG